MSSSRMMAYCAEKHSSVSQPATQSCWYFFPVQTFLLSKWIFFSILFYNPITQDSFLLSVTLPVATIYNIDLLFGHFFYIRCKSRLQKTVLYRLIYFFTYPGKYLLDILAQMSIWVEVWSLIKHMKVVPSVEYHCFLPLWRTQSLASWSELNLKLLNLCY